LPFVRDMKSVDALGCVCSAVILLLASVRIPVIGSFLSLLTPLPFLYYATKMGLQEGLKVVAFAGVVVGVLTYLLGYPQILLGYVEFSVVGMILAKAYQRGFSFGYTVFWGTILMLFVGLIMVTLLGLTKGGGPQAIIQEVLQNDLKGSLLQIYPEMASDPEQSQKAETFVNAVIAFIARIYPAVVIVYAGFTVWLNIVISRPLFRIANLRYPGFGRADRWSSPEGMVWGLIAAGFSLFLPVHGIKFLAINTVIVLSVIYVFHGLSVLLFFFNKYRVPSWLRVVGYFLIFFQFLFFGIGLAMAGLFDQWIDFRKIHYRKATE